MTRVALLLTCEHATNRVPREYRRAFASPAAQAALGTHRGYDRGAKGVASALAERLKSASSLVRGPLDGEVTRLLVDLNRSPPHPDLFSSYARALRDEERAELLRRYYEPHHRRVRASLGELLQRASLVLHLGVHSFTPLLDGHERKADVGLLYDPSRAREREFAGALWQGFKEHAVALRVRRNYPYRGIADGLTTMLRRELPRTRYAGFELELNQRSLESRRFVGSVVEVVARVLETWLR